MDYGLKVAKKDIDVKKKHKYVFISTYNSLKGRESGGGIVTLPFKEKTGFAIQEIDIIIEHNFGYIPFTMVYGENPISDDVVEVPMEYSYGLNGIGYVLDENNLTITYYRFSGIADLPEVTKKYKYYFFANKII